MRAAYMGKEGEVTIWGLTFPRGEAVEIPDSNTHARAKVVTHPEFVVDDAGKPEAPAKPESRKK